MFESVQHEDLLEVQHIQHSVSMTNGGVHPRADASADSMAKVPLFAKTLVPSVMLLPAGRGRRRKKQNRTSSEVSGEQPRSSSLPSAEEAARLPLLLSLCVRRSCLEDVLRPHPPCSLNRRTINVISFPLLCRLPPVLSTGTSYTPFRIRH